MIKKKISQYFTSVYTILKKGLKIMHFFKLILVLIIVDI